MAEILLYGGVLILAGAIAFVFFRQVLHPQSGDRPSLPLRGEQPQPSADFRPRDASGQIMEPVQKAAMPDNREHPSGRYLKEVEANLEAIGGDVRKLFLPERNFMLAYHFEKHLNGEGLIGFLRAFPNREVWHLTKDALFIVRADEYHSVFENFLESEGDRTAEALAAGNLAEFRFLKDWNTMLLGSRTGQNDAEKASYMKRRLDHYCDEGDE